MSEKVIRIWDGCRVVQVIAVRDGSTSTLGAPGGAANSIRVDIEIDPWAGYLVEHNERGNGVVDFRSPEGGMP